MENRNFENHEVIDKDKNAMWQTPAANKRFGAMAAEVITHTAVIV